MKDSADTVPTFIDTDRVYNLVMAMGATPDPDELDFSECIHGTRTAYFCIDGLPRRLDLTLRRFLNDARSIVMHQANNADDFDCRTRGDGGAVFIDLFASADENVVGRCMALQTCASRSKIPRVFVTLIDCRLTVHRLADFINQAIRCASYKASVVDGDIETLKAQIHTSLARVVSAWPDAVRARSPDTFSMLLRRQAPAPIERLSGGAVSLAGGRLVIAPIGADLARRILCAHDTAISSGRFWPWGASLTRACSDARGIDTPTSIRPRRMTILVCQEHGAQLGCAGDLPSIFQDISAPCSRMLVSGVPMANIVHLVHTIIEEWGLEDIATLISSASGDDIVRDEQLRIERVEAMDTIVRLLGRDSMIERIKQVVWRPGGRLVKKMVDDAA